LALTKHPVPIMATAVKATSLICSSQEWATRGRSSDG